MFRAWPVCCVVAIAIVPCGGRLSAQVNPDGPPRIAVINMVDVVSNYTKAKESKQTMTALLAPYQKMHSSLQAELARLQQVVKDSPQDTATRDVAEAKLKVIQRQIEDLGAEGRKIATQKSEQQVVEIYRDIEAAVQRYAESHQIDLVLTYSEPAKEERMKHANITRKMQTGATMPLYIRPRLDITQAVIQSLNDAYAAKK
jgi:Skp family chaperone for outer membrane proteins